jgi:hypothetical protein
VTFGAANGSSVLDWGLALKSLDTDSMVSVKLSGGGLFEGNKYLGEKLAVGADQFFEAVKQDKVREFLLAHPEFVNKNS